MMVNVFNRFNRCIKLWRHQKQNWTEYEKLNIIDQYNWKGIIYPLGNDNWKKFKSNPTIGLYFYMLKYIMYIVCLMTIYVQSLKNKSFSY